ncbi:hypothetical protein ACROYT_G037132, partial [Oculina patagonica]
QNMAYPTIDCKGLVALFNLSKSIKLLFTTGKTATGSAVHLKATRFSSKDRKFTSHVQLNRSYHRRVHLIQMLNQESPSLGVSLTGFWYHLNDLFKSQMVVYLL